MAIPPDAPATARERALLGHLGDHESANDPRLTHSRAAARIDRLKGVGAPAPPPLPPPSPPPPSPVERATTTVEPVDPAEPWVQIAAWLPVNRLDGVLAAIREARGAVE